MPVVQTGDLTPESRSDQNSTLQTYCGLDCCITLEVFHAIQATSPSPEAQVIYSFERALQAPYLEIMQRGFHVDVISRRRAADAINKRLDALRYRLNLMAEAVWGKTLNPRSPAQLADFFYSAMKLPEVWLSKKGVRRISTDREALEKLDIYLHARPFVSVILTIRDLSKQLDVFEGEIDPDNRFRTSYNIAGTETGRPSSSTNAFGTGGNAQNIAPGLRHVFDADRGTKLCVIDLEQVEARDVGFFCGCLFDDWTFLDSCESGDLHTNNAKLIWPELDWGNSPQDARKRADTLFYRDFSYRDMAKRGSHLSNYSGTAWTMARALKIPQVLAEDFQARYCRGESSAFPAIARWWQWTATQLQSQHWLMTPFQRKRHFFGRADDPTTLREAIAFSPQSTTADRMNLGLWRTWKREPSAQLLAQTYDSITFQAPDGPGFDDLVGRVLEHIKVELIAPNGRRYVVPGEAKIGWNWGSASTTNPEGLIKWKRDAPDQRVRRTGLDRIMGRA